ncbi:MAG: carbohydrate ABC transporter permease [Clostridia bacterium]|nr:carbohydrate ABC transporter permease [Clostridia bacterium]
MGKRAGMIKTIILFPLALIVIYPFLFIVATSLKEQTEISANPYGLIFTPTLENYVAVFERFSVARSLLNNFEITIFSVAGIVIFAAMAAYPIVFNPNRFNKMISGLIIMGYLIPTQALLIPVYQIMIKTKLINQVPGVIFLYLAGSSLAVFLYVGYMKTLPKDLFESATIDGCGVWGCFWKIIFPLMTPMIATVVIFNVFFVWNDFINPYLFLSSPENATLVLQVLKTRDQFAVEWGLGLSITTVIMLPLLVFYIFTQKYLIKGMTEGAVKG